MTAPRATGIPSRARIITLLHGAGMARRDLAALVGIPEGSMGMVYARLGLEGRRRSVKGPQLHDLPDDVIATVRIWQAAGCPPGPDDPHRKATEPRPARDRDSLIRHLVQAGMPIRQAAAVMGMSAAGVSAAARRLGLRPDSGTWPSRNIAITPDLQAAIDRWGGESPAADPEPHPARAPQKPARTKPPSAPSANGRWDAATDAAIIATGGLYADIAALSDKIGRPTRAIVARWHRLRAG